ncbi:hypothetical protein PsYK624_112520 [Phanerochaete sordida]|uniref:DUF6535 domain-containing protein n=1 Tax=Phanerochaete sordida TaxID=48140 RepID=A0A9P3GFI8_9APHY|nr:hypothetical protein PsYK624_112520 [Phanerochaete sordida]
MTGSVSASESKSFIGEDSEQATDDNVSAKALKGDKSASAGAETDGKETISEKDVTAGWTYLLSAGQDYDEEKTDNWKSEIDNLLVFAGLFSGVVTSFTLESYSWLSPDSADTTNQLLLQISAQLAAFAVSPGYANSTAPIAAIPASFTPDHTDVLINMLWFLSLTFSLIAVFFAIAAQQWLRALPLPRHIPLKDSVRLWQSRRTHFIGFQVPNIIIMLPVLLQVAVILFLVGLYYLLQSLNHPITTAFAIVAGIPFFLYGLSLFGPLLFPSNPFKSPIVPVAMFVVNWAIMVLGVLALILFLVPFVIVAGLLILWATRATGNREYYYTFTLYIRRAIDWYLALAQKLSRLMSSIFTRDQDFWTAREVRALAREDADAAADECGAALALAPCAVPRHELVRLRACLRALPPRQRMNVVLSWATLYSGNYSETDFDQANEWAPVNVGLLRGVDGAFARAFAPCFVAALPGDWAACDWVADCANTTSVLVLLARIVCTGCGDAELSKSVTRTLLEVVRCQRPEDITSSGSGENFRFPAVCLFDCFTHCPDALSAEDLTAFMALTVARLPILHALNDKFAQRFTIQQTEYVLASAGVALRALARLDDAAWPALAPAAHAFLRALDDFVCAERAGIRFVGALAAERPRELLIVAPRAAKAVSEAVVRLAEAGRLPDELRDDLVGHLSDVWAGQRAFGEAEEVLCRAEPGGLDLGSNGASEKTSQVEGTLERALGEAEELRGALVGHLSAAWAGQRAFRDAEEALCLAEQVLDAGSRESSEKADQLEVASK